MADACECGNEPPGSVKCGEFLNSCITVSCSGRTLHRGVRKYYVPGPGIGVMTRFVSSGQCCCVRYAPSRLYFASVSDWRVAVS